MTDTQSSQQGAYEAGRDCGLNGPDTRNCHFRIFGSPEQTKSWERGKLFGKTLKSRENRKEGQG